MNRLSIFCLKFQIDLRKKTLTFRNFTPLEVPRYDTTTLHKFKVLLFFVLPFLFKDFWIPKVELLAEIIDTYYIKIKITCKTLRFYLRSKICAAWINLTFYYIRQSACCDLSLFQYKCFIFREARNPDMFLFTVCCVWKNISDPRAWLATPGG